MRLPDLTVDAGGLPSNPVKLVGVNKVSVFAPPAVTGQISIQVSPDGVVWYDTGQTVAGGDVTTLEVVAGFLRVNSNQAEAAERVFPLFASGPVY